MKACFLIFAVTCLFSCSSEERQPYEQITKLSGTWMVSDGEGGSYEVWSKSVGDSMIGRAYKLSGPSDTIVSERIVLKKDGETLWYIPTVTGQNNAQPVRFKLITYNDSAFTFENKEHDFPQRVIYRFINNDSIVATIEGLDSSVRRYFDFYYTRMK
jgi:hypothetical protein